MELTENNIPRILVVEDEASVAKVMSIRLESYGYHVCGVVSSGQAAIDAAVSLKPDIIIMDIIMEGTVDGIEAARQIHSRMDVPIIFLTAYKDEELLKRARSTEPSGYIIKPYEGSQLRISVEITLYKHQQERERIRLVNELKQALKEIKRLSGLLPICSHCKKIRDDKGYWSQVEAYIQEHSEAVFTHGICPECAEKYYPEFYKKPED